VRGFAQLVARRRGVLTPRAGSRRAPAPCERGRRAERRAEHEVPQRAAAAAAAAATRTVAAAAAAARPPTRRRRDGRVVVVAAAGRREPLVEARQRLARDGVAKRGSARGG